jgi:hypothetical protein
MQVKNKPREGVMNVHLFLGLLLSYQPFKCFSAKLDKIFNLKVPPSEEVKFKLISD